MVQLKDEIYLTGEDITESNNVIVIITEGNYENIVNEYGKNEKLKLLVGFQEKDNTGKFKPINIKWTPNSRSRRILSRELGTDTKFWVGKKITLGTYEKKMQDNGEQVIKKIIKVLKIN